MKKSPQVYLDVGVCYANVEVGEETIQFALEESYLADGYGGRYIVCLQEPGDVKNGSYTKLSPEKTENFSFGLTCSFIARDGKTKISSKYDQATNVGNFQAFDEQGEKMNGDQDHCLLSALIRSMMCLVFASLLASCGRLPCQLRESKYACGGES